MLILKMDNNKQLSITKRSRTFKDENKAEKIRIIAPQIFNGYNLMDCNVDFCAINDNNELEIINISSLLERYNDEYYFCEIEMTNKLTQKDGQVGLWIKILNSSSEMIAKTNVVRYTVYNHIDIEGVMPDADIHLLEELEIKVDEAIENIVTMSETLTTTINSLTEIITSVTNMTEYINELKQGQVLLVQPPIEENIDG